MANLKLELDEYLNKGQTNRSNNGHVHIPKVFKKFLNNESGEQTENLLDPTHNKYFNFPTLVKYMFKLFKLIYRVSNIYIFLCYLILQSKTQRIIGFIICVAVSCLMFSLSVLYLPVLLLKARKFAILYASGSIFAFIR